MWFKAVPLLFSEPTVRGSRVKTQIRRPWPRYPVVAMGDHQAGAVPSSSTAFDRERQQLLSEITKGVSDIAGSIETIALNARIISQVGQSLQLSAAPWILLDECVAGQHRSR
ncbi:unnamed protein product (mitochondrion) [Plasmodiophora brassicae]|uniref:Uncharacterized protein n=1 Tax=Plasmodiophora brassicae TaxID=37360 RepID=A0A3P3YE00_PLABS|nr:unnamed protein product [Plasmodiophora brassicae]